MADDSARTDVSETSKAKGWGKLRGKILDKENKLSQRLRRHQDQPSDQDVDDFLRPSTQTLTNAATPPAPKLDISAAKGANDASADDGGFLDSVSAKVGGEGGIPSYAPTREDMVSGKWTPHKPTRRPGLQVGFLDGSVDVIGEGGDESEESPLMIGDRRRRALAESRRHNVQKYSDDSRSPERDSPVPGRLKRAQTGLAEGTTDARPSASPERRHTERVPQSAMPQGRPRKPSAVAYPPPSSTRRPSAPDDRDLDQGAEEEEIIRPLRRAPTGFDEARQHQQRAADPSSELHLSSPDSPPSSQVHQSSYEQQMQQILTNTYSQPLRNSRDASPMDHSPQRRPLDTSGHANVDALNPPPPSLRTTSRSPNRSAVRRAPDDQAPELRSPVDSGSMRKMRAEEGLAHRSSVQGISGVQGGDSSVAAALAKLSPGLDAPPPYSTQARSSFDSTRSNGSDRSRYSHSPEPTSLPPGQRYSTASIDQGQFLSPPPSAHGQPTRPDPLHRRGAGSQDSLPPSFHERPDPTETTIASSGRTPVASDRQPSLNVTALESQRRRGGGTVPSTASDPNAEEAYTHFASAISGTGSIFRLAAENAGVQMTLYDWTRCALWWFLKGREGIEEYNRFRASQRAPSPVPAAGPGPSPEKLRQYHLNLAKSYWILTEIVPNLLNNAQSDLKTCPPSQSLSSVDAACSLLNELFKPLCLSMRRHDILPPPQEKLVQGLDTAIWLPQPFERLPPDWQWVLSGKVFSPPRQTPDVEPMAAMPLQGSRNSYCYGRVFVSATVAIGDDKPVAEPVECVLSFVRGKMSAEAEITISSQSNDVNIHVRAAGEHGVHWEHTRFDPDERSLRIKLPQKLRLKLFCSQKDYSYLWSFFDNSQRISTSLAPKRSERLLQSLRLRSFHYRDSSHPDEFPSDPVGICKMALFEQVLQPDRDVRKVHAGHRLAVVNLEKTVRNVNISFGRSAPFEYNIQTSQPTLQFQLNEAGRRRSAHLVFEDMNERDLLRDLLSGTVLGPNESVIGQFAVSSIAYSRAAASNLPPVALRWPSLKVIVEDDPADPQHLNTSADGSENLRVMLYSRTGSIVDRMSDGAVDFKIRLEPNPTEQLQIFRSAGRLDMTIAIGPDPSETHELRQIFDVATSGPHVSAYNFKSVKDLHSFQRAVTGFAVIYDGVASSFSIPRRKPGSVVARHLESQETRVQIVERERVIQLVAFFHDYILADSMNFELKATDKFDQSDSKTLGFGVKLVDAKFVLPGSGKDDPIKDGAVRGADAKYTAFETESYNQEHDDITISFRTEQERDRFAEALPAPVSLGRKFTLRRRI